MEAEQSDTVTLIVPATTAHLRLARLIASGVASLSDLDFDTIEDLRIAVDELCAVLLEQARPQAHLRLRYRVREGSTVEVEGDVDAGRDGAPDVPELTRQILSAVIDRYDIGAEGGRLTFSLARSLSPANTA